VQHHHAHVRAGGTRGVAAGSHARTLSARGLTFPVINAIETNFDGLVGPTHNYAGLSEGNLASGLHAKRVSRPRAAALQGLAKMEAVAALGLPQGFLPPHERPALWALREAGFAGSDEAVLAAAARGAGARVAIHLGRGLYGALDKGPGGKALCFELAVERQGELAPSG
jgi:hypothetical protein